MIYSATCQYAMRALSRMAMEPTAGFVKVRQLAEAEGLPPAFLARVLGLLVDGGLLRSARGPSGGFALARAAEEITLYEIRRVVDGVEDLTACAVGLKHCDDLVPCPLHESWKPIREGVDRYLRRTTLRDMTDALGWPDVPAPD